MEPKPQPAPVQGTAALLTIPSYLTRIPLNANPQGKQNSAKNNKGAGYDCLTSGLLRREGGDKAGCEKHPGEGTEKSEKKQPTKLPAALTDSKSWKGYRQ